MQKEFKPAKDYQLWRYGIISQLLHRGENDPPLSTMFQDIADKTYLTPHGEHRQISRDTIRNWYYRYTNKGIDALANKPRCDRKSSTVPLSMQTSLINLRQSHPESTVKKLLDKLKEQNLWDGRCPSRNSLYRFASVNEITRKPSKHSEPVRSFEFPNFGNLWSADFLHGPKVIMGRKRPKSYLNAIIDDASRYIVATSFHTTENTRSFLRDFLLAIRRFGIPQRLYTDNGAAYRSKHLGAIAAKLGIAMPHTPPYWPRGRGKIERFFRTVRDCFLADRKITSLKKLNSDFDVWINEYHNKPHSALGMSPLNRKLICNGTELKQIPLTKNINDIFRLETAKKIGSDGCIRLLNKRFEVRDALPGEKIIVYYLPWDTDYVLTGPDKLKAKILDVQKNSQRFNKPKRLNSNQKEQN